MAAGSSPWPSLHTLTITQPPFTVAETRMCPPESVWRRALSSRLKSTCWIRSLSARGLGLSRQAAAANLGLFACHAAVPLLEQALHCLEHLPPTPERRVAAIDIRLTMGQVSVYSHPGKQGEWVRPAMAAAELTRSAWPGAES